MSFVILFLFPVVLRAAADDDTAGLLGKLEEVFAARATNMISTNQASLLSPPLPEIPPTAWERFGWIVWLVLPFFVMLVGIFAAILLRQRKPPLLVSPVAQVRVALASLQEQSEDGATLSKVSRALGRYLVAAFWLNPGETTTAELCAALANNAQVGPELSGSIAQFLRACDERKFSPGQMATPLDAVRQATKLVDLAEARRAANFAANTPPRLS